MTNGQLPTWFVQKWLSTHECHRAKAPDSAHFFPCTATNSGMGVSFVTHYLVRDGGDLCGSAPTRNDWTLYRADGKPVRFKRRAKLKRVGAFGGGERLRAEGTSHLIRPLLVAGTRQLFDIYVRERT